MEHNLVRRGSLARHEFQAVAPSKHIERMQRARKEKDELGIALSEVFLGISIERKGDQEVDIGFACSDGTYNIDFAVHTLNEYGQEASDGLGCNAALPPSKVKQADVIAEYLICSIRDYQGKNYYKFVGAGLADEILDICPKLPSRLWSELDIVPILVKDAEGGSMDAAKRTDNVLGVDELADSLTRKCIGFFGPNNQPRVQVGFSNKVEVDIANRALLTTLDQYKDTVNEHTWNTVLEYAANLKERETRIAFFSATPQAVAGPDERLSTEQQATIHDWVQMNADRFWTREGGPLAHSSKGGADVIIVDDPQMPNIIDIAKSIEPDRPVVFRSHIQIRADLADKPETPTGGVWQWLWSSVQHADLFIAHPVSAFVPSAVDKRILGYMPATTDWLDGLNKELSDFDSEYYVHEFNTECNRQRMTSLAFPKRDYIVQIARFDPSKGIPDVVASYAEFRRNSNFCQGKGKEETPQLVIAGHYSVDDPDGVRVLNETLELLNTEYNDVKDCVITMRLGPTDQLLNVLMSNARVALQLSTREGFEVKVSEALHKGVPVIATTAGGIPVQVQPEKSGFLVEPGDYKAVAKHLDTLFSDENRYKEMSAFAASHVSDEVGTVGNAVNWMYLADQLSQRKKVEPGGQWIWDMARDEVGEERMEGEVRLPRDWTT
ncbi:Trehalose phosphorylase [Pseudocercospora fuligena]|uniref:Trehalose phosphorylase n=1 Tax=Pseudocercospora fuligena TaxID=685502 RepID=A0A8H6RJA7_9PEZI|nr:Trehalose phosphorylase [Pseudocercospora fuligena]